MAIERIRGVLTALVLLALAPAAGAVPDIRHWETGNGARVYFVPAPQLPMVDLRVTFDAGSARDGGRAGLAQLTNALLDDGTAERGADAVAAGFEDLGAVFGTGALRDMAWVSLRSLSDPARLDPAVALFADVIAHPGFPADAFERELQQMRVAARQRRQQPDAVAEEAFYRALYGEHPYATPPGGTRESLAALERDAVRAFHRRHYVARNAVIAIVGDLDRAAAEALAERVTAGLPAGEPAPALPPVTALEAAAGRDIAHPASQSHLLMGQPGMTRDDPDYFPLYVGNYVLGGGGLVSRLNEAVREERGLSYSVYSYFMPMARKGPFQLGLQTRNDQLPEALTVVREVLEGYVAEGPTAEELEAARKHITGGFPLRIDSNRKMVDYLAMIGFYDLPLDYLDTFNDKVHAVTLESVRDAFRRRVHPERMVTVVVGGSVDGD